MTVKKRAMTLLEMMLVMFLIAIIGSVLSYNMRGSLEKGKAFKSEQGSKQVHDILTLAQAEGSLKSSASLDKKQIETALQGSGLVKDINKLLQDGWGTPYDIFYGDSDEIIVKSDRWLTYLKAKQNLSEAEIREQYPWALEDS